MERCQACAVRDINKWNCWDFMFSPVLCVFESKYIYITSRPIFKGDVVRRLFMHVSMYACMYVQRL